MNDHFPVQNPGRCCFWYAVHDGGGDDDGDYDVLDYDARDDDGDEIFEDVLEEDAEVEEENWLTHRHH